MYVNQRNLNFFDTFRWFTNIAYFKAHLFNILK